MKGLEYYINKEMLYTIIFMIVISLLAVYFIDPVLMAYLSFIILCMNSYAMFIYFSLKKNSSHQDADRQ